MNFVPLAEGAHPITILDDRQHEAYEWLLGTLRTLGERHAKPVAEELFSLSLETGPYQVLYKIWEGRLEPFAYTFNGETEFRDSYFSRLGRPRQGRLNAITRLWERSLDENPRVIPGLDLRDFKKDGHRPVEWTRIPAASAIHDPFIIPNFFSVYSPSNDYVNTAMPYILPRLRRTDKVLVMGSGSGVDTVWIAEGLGLQVDAVDKNPLAVANTHYSARVHDVDHLVSAWQSNLFEKVTGHYDAVVFMAPLAVAEDFYSGDANRFDPGGQTFWNFVSQVRSHLLPGGRVYLLAEPSKRKGLETYFLTEKIVQFDAGLNFAIFELTSRY